MEWAHLFVLCISLGFVVALEVAVIVGGNKDASTYLTNVEVYTAHLPNGQQNCKGTGLAPTVPDLPVRLAGASAVYLPDFGIYVCGGYSPDTGYEGFCYRYSPKVNFK